MKKRRILGDSKQATAFGKRTAKTLYGVCELSGWLNAVLVDLDLA